MGKRAPAPAVPEAATWGQAGVLLSLGLWSLTQQVKAAASRLEESWFVGDTERPFLALWPVFEQ